MIGTTVVLPHAASKFDDRTLTCLSWTVIEYILGKKLKPNSILNSKKKFKMCPNLQNPFKLF